MTPGDRTSMGGPRERFETIDWTAIVRAQASDADVRRPALENLCRQYWKPVYCYLRRKGHDNETAKDLTEGFFAEVAGGDRDVSWSASATGRLLHVGASAGPANTPRQLQPRANGAATADPIRPASVRAVNVPLAAAAPQGRRGRLLSPVVESA